MDATTVNVLPQRFAVFHDVVKETAAADAETVAHVVNGAEVKRDAVVEPAFVRLDVELAEEEQVFTILFRKPEQNNVADQVVVVGWIVEDAGESEFRELVFIAERIRAEDGVARAVHARQ